MQIDVKLCFTQLFWLPLWFIYLFVCIVLCNLMSIYPLTQTTEHFVIFKNFSDLKIQKGQISKISIETGAA